MTEKLFDSIPVVNFVYVERSTVVVVVVLDTRMGIWQGNEKKWNAQKCPQNKQNTNPSLSPLLQGVPPSRFISALSGKPREIDYAPIHLIPWSCPGPRDAPCCMGLSSDAPKMHLIPWNCPGMSQDASCRMGLSLDAPRCSSRPVPKVPLLDLRPRIIWGYLFVQGEPHRPVQHVPLEAGYWEVLT